MYRPRHQPLRCRHPDRTAAAEFPAVSTIRVGCIHSRTPCRLNPTRIVGRSCNFSYPLRYRRALDMGKSHSVLSTSGINGRILDGLMAPNLLLISQHSSRRESPSSVLEVAHCLPLSTLMADSSHFGIAYSEGIFVITSRAIRVLITVPNLRSQ